MIETRTVKTADVNDGAYRNTWSVTANQKPILFELMFNNLVDRVKAGNDLPVHVAEVGTGVYQVIDGHVALDVYRYMGRKEVQVIIHKGVANQKQALENYIAMNYLRSVDWLRDSVKLRELLVQIGVDKAPKLMEDGELALDLISRDQTRWDAFATVYDNPNEAPEDNPLFG